MNTVRQIVVFATITLSLSLSLAAAQAESKNESNAEKEVGDKFQLDWTRISYSKTVSLHNTETSENQAQDVSERMSLSCEVEILDPNFVLGISRSPVIEEILDDKDSKIEINSRVPSSFRLRYEAPRYHRRFVRPKKPAKWKTAIRSALRLPPKESSQPRLVEQIRPIRMQIDLDVGLGEKTPDKINCVKGYFYALMAESYEYVEIPFKKSDEWVRLTPDVEVQIAEAWLRNSRYYLNTKGRPQGAQPIHNLSAETYLPTRLVMNRQLLGPDDKPVRQHRSSFLPYHVGGSSSGGGGDFDKITKIRYVIAVNPSHYEIPFMLENIPLPKP